MTITLKKRHLVFTILALVVAVPATAYAAHVFDDVPDGAFYADPVAWAFDNGITTGKSATAFAPLDNVTRGESVTFLKRYNDNIVQPAITDLATNTSDIASLEAGAPTITRINWRGETTDGSVSTSWEKVRDLGSFTKNSETTDIIISADGHMSVTGSWCQYQIRIDGLTDVGAAPSGWRELDGAKAVAYDTSAWFIEGLFPDLTAGSHTVELWLRGSATACEDNTGDFAHQVLVTEQAAA
jgi:hypothetical protein